MVAGSSSSLPAPSSNFPHTLKDGEVPEWLIMLFIAQFFEVCQEHTNEKKNYFCINCILTFCPDCLYTHYKHKYIQIRKYVYRNVVNLKDMQKFFNCSGIQRFKTNNANILHLTARSSHSKNQPNIVYKNACSSCKVGLPGAFNYCSVACKVGKGKLESFISVNSTSSSSDASADITNNDDETSESHTEKRNFRSITRMRKQKNPVRSPSF